MKAADAGLRIAGSDSCDHCHGAFDDRGAYCATCFQRALQAFEELRAKPQSVWRCFHCDEVFTDEVEARSHFGDNEFARAGCQLNTAEKGILVALREAERHVGKLQNANEQLDHEAGSYHAQRSELERHFGKGVTTAHAAWLRLEAKDGALEAAAERFTEHTKAVGAFLNELYAVMVDPCAEGTLSVTDMKAALLAAAVRDRDAAQERSQG